MDSNLVKFNKPLTNSITVAQPIADNTAWIIRILLFCNIRNANIVNFVLMQCANDRILNCYICYFFLPCLLYNYRFF